jgi:hypothetical protein
MNGLSGNQPFNLTINLNNPANGLANPTVPTTDEERRTFRYLTPVSIQAWNHDIRNGVVQKWNFTVQEQTFGDWIFTGAYAGSKGNHLFMTSQANPAIFGRTGTVDQLRLYGPVFSSITDYSLRGNSIDHSLQLTANIRLTRSFAALANYTWSKLIGDSSGDGDAPADPFNFRHERGPSDLDVPHRFVASFLWALPKLAGQHAAVRHALGGWETNGIVSLTSGGWVNIVSGVDNSQSANNNDRGDLVGNPALPGGRSRDEQIARYFHTAAFTVSARGTFGNVGRNILRGRGDATVDFGLFKNFQCWSDCGCRCAASSSISSTG